MGKEEKALESELASALSLPATLGKPRTTALKVGADKCQPDLTQCPETFTKKGSVCSAPATYSGPCVSELNLTGMGVEQKLAIAQQCKLEFPCQGDCAQDF